jgi:SAM-dependent methyltransferase
MIALKYRYTTDAPLDAPERTMLHGNIIRNKHFLRKLYTEWYSLFSDEIRQNPGEKYIELGAGGGFLKELEPSVICTDVLPLSTNDMTFSALSMPFADESVWGIFMIDTFHHLPDVRQFLTEANRVLKCGGVILMIEPANSWWGRFIYRHFHHEPFNPAGEWVIPESGPLSGANGALPWIVFRRDREFYTREFPRLKIEHIRYHTPLRYLLSGGVSYRQLMPSFSYRLFSCIDFLLVRVSSQFSMFTTIRIRKL